MTEGHKSSFQPKPEITPGLPEEPKLGDILIQYRLEAGLSQNALARRAGLNPTNINRIERSKQGIPRPSTMVKIIGALGYDLTDERAQRLLEMTSVKKAQPESTKLLPASGVIFEAKLHEAEEAALKAWQNVLDLRKLWNQMNQK